MFCSGGETSLMLYLICRRGETNRCASTVPMDAGYSTEYVSQSQLPAPNVLYDSVQLPQRNESKVVLGDSKDALKKTLKEAMQSTEAWKAAMSPRRDTRGLR